MVRYARLKELGFDTDDSELFEVGEVSMNLFDKLADVGGELGLSVEAERARQLKTNRDGMYFVPSIVSATDTFSVLQGSKGCPASRLAQEQKQKEQGIENGNPNFCSPDRTTQPAVVAICSHNSAVGGASLQEQQPQRGGRGGASPTGRWVGRNIEERSGRWRSVGCESYHRGNAPSVLENGTNSTAPSSSPTCGRWAPSIQRGTSYREREPAFDYQSHEERFLSRVDGQPQHPQSQEEQSCTLHASCNDVRYSQRFLKESCPLEDPFNAPITTLPSVKYPKSHASDGSCFTQEKDPTFQRSSSAKEAPSLQRNSSTRDPSGRRYEMSVENWRDYPASRSAHVSDRTKHRVSFTLTENHQLETKKLREKFRDPTPCRKVLQASQQGTNQQPLSSSSEEPGFDGREKENICGGKSYTIYGVKEAKDCNKASSGRYHQFVRACSLRENDSDYTKMQRAHSVNAGSGGHGLPMECDTCGKGGIGIVFLGLRGNKANFWKACKSSSGSDWCCGESKAPKKKSIMDYYRKILGLPQKPR